mgnify:CR=1 FL=1|tara:strand:- start:491 stop:802 length:312 start_codon:yes stop_codon:yes gene_type:complete
MYEKTQKDSLREADKVMKNVKALMMEDTRTKTPSIQQKIRKNKSVKKRRMEMKKVEEEKIKKQLEIRRLKKKLAQEENLNLIDRMNYQDNFEIVNASSKNGQS